MKFKMSRYTQMIQCDVGIMMYNSLSGKILYVSDETIIKEIDKGEFGSISTRERLISLGFLVNDNDTEDESARLALFDKIANNDLSLTILPTLQCNFRCEYCYEDFKNEKITDATINGIVEFVKNNIHGFNRLIVDWFGGEPLLEIEKINELSQKLIQVCRKYRKPYIASMTTNGYLLTKDVFKMMLRNKVISYQITLDGDEENHNQNRHLANGSGTYRRILDNLISIHNNISTHFSIVIRTNFTSEMAERMEPYIRFLYNNFGEDRRFSFLFRPVGDWGGYRVSQIQSTIISDFSYVLDKMIYSKVQLNYGVYYGILKNGICEAAKRNSYIIKPSGEICKCTCLLDLPDNQVGQLDENGNMNLNKNLLSKWVYRFDKIPNHCTSCSMLPICGNSSCPANILLSKIDYSCGYENYYIKEILTLFSRDIEKYGFVEVLNDE